MVKHYGKVVVLTINLLMGCHWELTCIAFQKLFIILTSTYLMHKLIIISFDSQESA